jgi:hypothetical protein
MVEDVTDAIEKKDLNMIKSLRGFEFANDKYTGYCRRVINKGHFNHKSITVMYCMIEELEKIADEYKYMCDFFTENPGLINEVGKEVKRLFGELKVFYKESYELFYKFDINRCAQLFSQRRALLKEAREMRVKRNARPTDLNLLAYFIVIIQHITNIVSFVLQMEI